MSEHSIKPNKTLEEIGLAWSQARSVVLALAQAQRQQPSSPKASSSAQPKSKKRKTKHSSNSDDSDLEVTANKNADDRSYSLRVCIVYFYADSAKCASQPDRDLPLVFQQDEELSDQCSPEQQLRLVFRCL